MNTSFAKDSLVALLTMSSHHLVSLLVNKGSESGIISEPANTFGVAVDWTYHKAMDSPIRLETLSTLDSSEK